MKTIFPLVCPKFGLAKKISLSVVLGLCSLMAQSQMVSTYAGNGAQANTQTGVQATATSLQNTNGLVVDVAGNLYICESNQFRIYKVSPSGVISLFAGNGSFAIGGDGAQATAAGIGRPEKIVIDAAGNFYFTCAQGNCVRKISTSGVITTIAGIGTAGFSGDGSLATSAQLNAPIGLAIDAAGNLYIADSNNNRIRKITASTGIITTIAGNGLLGNSGDGGLATAASINAAVVALDGTGNIYFDNYATVRKIDVATGIVTRVAGNTNMGYSGDGGPATSAQMVNIFDLKVDASGNLYIPHWTADGVIRKVNTSGIISTIAGTGTVGFSGDGSDPLTAQFNNMNGLAMDASGNLFIGDNFNRRIRKIDFMASPICPASLSLTKIRGANGQATIIPVITPSVGTPGYTGVISGNPLTNPLAAVNFTTASSYSYGFPGNGIYHVTVNYTDMVSGFNCSRSKSDTILINNSTTGKHFNRKFSLSNNYFCNTGTVTFRDTTRIIYSLNNPLATYTIVTNWGNGTTVTNTVNTTSQINLSSAAATFSNPGVYTVMSIIKGAGIANDTVIKTLTVDACGPLSGMVYNDADNNCSQAWNEQGITNIGVRLTQGTNSYMAWTGPGGFYSFGNIPVGTYTIQSYPGTTGYTVTCGSSMVHAVTIGTVGIAQQNFAMNCSGGFDVAVTGISLYDGFYPGQTDRILPHVGILNGTCDFVIPGKVKMVLTPCVQYVPGGTSVNPPNAVIPAAGGDTLVWNVSDINAIGNFNYWNYAVSAKTCTNAVVGDSACITMIVLPTSGDVNPANNILTHCFPIGVSYDPNYKAAEPAGKGLRGDIPASTDGLTYTIHFQNTGTAKAFNIYLLDTISSNLNINSIEILSASHHMQPYLLESRTMKFMFANIMLPDSNTNEPLSHGFVTYRIKLNPGLTPNTSIKNTAYIYFDYNTPVVTNTALNTIEDLSVASGFKTLERPKGIHVFPNPAHNKVTITVEESGEGMIVITDILGKEVLHSALDERQAEVNTEALKEGVYMVKVVQGEHTFAQKLVISK